jgi:hypothetical protein
MPSSPPAAKKEFTTERTETTEQSTAFRSVMIKDYGSLFLDLAFLVCLFSAASVVSVGVPSLA